MSHLVLALDFTLPHFQTDAGCNRPDNNKLFKYNTEQKKANNAAKQYRHRK